MTMGTSAPPTGSTNITPTISATRPSRTSSHGDTMLSRASTTTPTASPTAISEAAAMATGPPGKTTGRVVISSCSLAKVTQEPENEIAPTNTVKAPAAAAMYVEVVAATCTSPPPAYAKK